MKEKKYLKRHLKKGKEGFDFKKLFKPTLSKIILTFILFILLRFMSLYCSILFFRGGGVQARCGIFLGKILPLLTENSLIAIILAYFISCLITFGLEKIKKR